MSKQPPQTTDLLVDISLKLEKVLKLLAIDAVKGYTKEQEKIELLDSLGFKPSEIAKFLNKSPVNVSVVLGSLRKKRGTKIKAEAMQNPSDSATKTDSEAKI